MSCYFTITFNFYQSFDIRIIHSNLDDLLYLLQQNNLERAASKTSTRARTIHQILKLIFSSKSHGPRIISLVIYPLVADKYVTWSIFKWMVEHFSLKYESFVSTFSPKKMFNVFIITLKRNLQTFISTVAWLLAGVKLATQHDISNPTLVK